MRDDEVNRWRVVLRVPWVARREPEAQNSDRTNVHGPLPYPRPAPQLDRATARLARDLLERRGEQLAAEHDRSSVRAQRYAAPGVEHLGDSGDPASELQVGRRTMHHVGPLRGEAGDLVRIRPDAVREHGAWPRDPHALEVGDFARPRGPQHRLALDD